MKVNPIAIMDFILTWEGVGRDEKRGMRSGVGGWGGGGRREEGGKERGKRGRGDDADGTLCTQTTSAGVAMLPHVHWLTIVRSRLLLLSCSSCFSERERGREGGRERERERERGREGGREGEREGGREGGREGHIMRCHNFSP